MSASTPQPPPKKKDKTLMYVLVGCGGCALLGVGAVVIALVGGAMFAKKKSSEFGTAVVSFQVVAQEAVLTGYLAGDDARTTRMQKIYKELGEMAQAGELKSEEMERLQRKIEDATKDSKLDSDEADDLLDSADGMTN